MSHSGIQRLTFVGNDADLTAAGTAYGAIAAGQIGIWDVDAATYLSANEAFIRTDAVSDAVGGAADELLGSPMIVPKRFQIVQGQSVGNPKCSAIIYNDDVIKIEHIIDTAETAATGSIDLTGLTTVVNVEISFKFVVTSLDTEYDSYLNPAGSDNWIGRVINYSYTTSVAITNNATLDAELALLVAEFNAIDNLPLTASYTAGTDVLVFTAEMGLGFRMLSPDFSAAATPPTVATVTNTGYARGNGDGRIVSSNEKKSFGYFGKHNNLYLPQEQEKFAVAATNYDTVILTWDQSAKGHANPWLFTGENSIEIAVPAGLTTQTNWDNAFGVAIGGATAQLYNKHNAGA